MSVLAATVLTSLLQGAQLEDRHAPKVRTDPPAGPEEPSDTPGLRSHQAPRALSPAAVTEDWPTFLGPRRDAHSRETHLASFEDAGPSLVWELDCGRGFASPVVAGDRLILTHRVAGEVHVDALEPTTGRRWWRFSYPTSYDDRYISNEGPRSTPTIAGTRVIVHGLENQLFCLDLASGVVLWQRDLAAELGVAIDFFGAVSSPLVHAGRVLVNVGAVKGPCVAAFDLATGRMVWGTGAEWGPSCASPVLGELGGQERLFVLAGGESRPPTGGLLVLDPGNGEELFRFPFRSKIVESVTGASPLIGPDFVFLSASYGTGSVCLESREGTFAQRWKNRRIGLQFSGPVLSDGLIWLIDGRSDRSGELVALDPATGEERLRHDLSWDERFDFDGRTIEHSFSVGEGSLLAVDGRFLCLGDNGHLLWLEADAERVKILSRAWLFRANETWTPPVVSQGLLWVRQTKDESYGEAKPRLLCYDLRAE
jgi:outer membrane protein assembly factor BamB